MDNEGTQRSKININYISSLSVLMNSTNIDIINIYYAIHINMYVNNNLTKYVVAEELTAGQLRLKCLQSNSTQHKGAG